MGIFGQAHKAHLAEAFRWSRETEVEAAAILTAGAGMAGPVLVAACFGHLAYGLTAAIGSMAIDATAMGGSIKAQLKTLATAFAPVAVASLAAAFIAGHGWMTDAMIVLLSGLAAIAGGYSQPMAAAGTRFVIFLIIGAHAGETGHAGGLLALIALGAIWTAILALALGALVRLPRNARTDKKQANVQPAPAASPAAKLAQWRQSLARLSGWQYPMRLVSCLTVAGILHSLWPEHRLYWVGLTVALLCLRPLEAFPVRTTQRSVGTIFGVFGASLLLALKPPAWALVFGIGLFAGLRPLLKVRNYLAYSTVMTPLVMLILDAGAPLEAGILADRLIATLTGAALTVAANQIFGRIFPQAVVAKA